MFNKIQEIGGCLFSSDYAKNVTVAELIEKENARMTSSPQKMLRNIQFSQNKESGKLLPL